MFTRSLIKCLNENDRETQRFAQLLQAFQWVAEPTQAGYAGAAALYRQCRAKGLTIRSTIDCVIAQLCLRDGLPLLAKDRDFGRIAQLVALKLVN